VVAEALRKYEDDILEDLTPRAYARWLAYFKIQQDRIDRQSRQAERKAKRGAKRGRR